MTFWKWSRTASVNATADSTCPFPEGMAPSAVNDGVRGAMAALAKYRDDRSGAIVTGGSSTAYTLTSYQGFDTLAHMDGALIAFAPHATNGANVTLNVDGLGAKPLRSASGVELAAAVVIQSSIYAATYNNSAGEWIMHGIFGNPYNVPLFGCIDFFDTIAPNSSFIFPRGQALSRTIYATAFARLGTGFGAGDGSTTFNVPDLSGRVMAMAEISATRLTTSYFGGFSTVMGATGGGESFTLVTANLPPYAPSGSVSVNSSNSDVLRGNPTNWANGTGGAFAAFNVGAVLNQQITSTGSLNGSAQGGTSTPLRTVQPTMVCNKIMRII